jgi:hypothetical protein
MPLKIMTDSDKNLDYLQAIIDSLFDDLSQYPGKRLLVKAQLYETLSRLIRTKEELQAKQNRQNSVTLDRIAAYLVRKGQITRKNLYRSGCFYGGVKVLDEALNVLDELGLLKTTISKNKQDIIYEFIQAEQKELQIIGTEEHTRS